MAGFFDFFKQACFQEAKVKGGERARDELDDFKGWGRGEDYVVDGVDNTVAGELRDA